MAKGILEKGIAGEYRDYAGAEQSAMALGALLSSLERSGAAGDQRGRLRKAVDDLMTVLNDDEGFLPDSYQTAMRELRSLLP